MAKSKNIQLNIGKRLVLKKMLDQGEKIDKISSALNVSKSTASRELARNRCKLKDSIVTGAPCQDCKNITDCNLRKLCDRDCNYKCKSCSLLKACNYKQVYKCKNIYRFPYVCDTCEHKKYCPKEQYTYDPNYADELSSFRRSETRKGINLANEEFVKLNNLVKEKTDMGQSIYHITHSNDLPVSTKTIYNYTNKGYLTTKPIDLPRAVKLKKRKKLPKKYEYNENSAIDRSGRKFSDFLRFKTLTSLDNYCEMDFLGESDDSEQRILCLTHTCAMAPFMFVLKKNCGKEDVVAVFDKLEETLGIDLFKKVFGVILTDRDIVFNDFDALERSIDGKNKRCSVFYCNPAASNEKPFVENQNGQIRMYFPKGMPIENLSQTKLTMINSHLFSFLLESLGGLCPYDALEIRFGSILLEKLGIIRIDPKEVKKVVYTKF